MLISVDTLHREFVGGHHPEWDVTPRIDALMAESVRLDHVVVPRGLSAVSMATMITGALPRTHGVRDNSAPDRTPLARTPTLAQRFSAAGFRTIGLSSNMCFLQTEDERVCTWEDEMPGIEQSAGDDLLVSRLPELTDEPTFLWVHFMDPHSPYSRRDPWYAAFHPDPYEGPMQQATEDALEAVVRGEVPYTAEDRRHIEALYASQVRATDARVGQVLDLLGERLDDAIVVFAVDHGDELARRTGYFFHGCSPYDGVIDTTWSIRAPGRIAAGGVLAARISSADVAPTVLELAGLPREGPAEGRSILDSLDGCAELRRDAFFERGPETAGVVSDGWKLLLSPRGGYGECKFYSPENPYPNEPVELYDLENDPLELTNLAGAEPELASLLEGKVCDWVNDGAWGEGDRWTRNALTHECAP